MKSFVDKVAIITGAGSGIGRALALALYREGARLALCDLNRLGLDETRSLMGTDGDRCSLHPVDVGSGDAMAAMAQDVLAAHHHVDLLINNAGISLLPTSFSDTPVDDFHRVIQVNMWGVYHGIHALLPHLQTRPEAAIVNVSSLAGLVGLVGYSAYAMSKSAVRALSESLRMELADTSVHVLGIYPGGVRTNLLRNAPHLTDEQRASSHATFTKAASLTADQVAERILWGIRRRRNRLILGIDAKIIYTIRRLFPRQYPTILNAVFTRMTFQ